MHKEKIVIYIMTLSLIGYVVSVGGECSALQTTESPFKIKEGFTNLLGGGKYISIEVFNGNGNIFIIYGFENLKNSINILCVTKKYIGIAEIPEPFGITSKVLDYYTFIAYRFEKIHRNGSYNNNGNSFEKSWFISSIRKNKIGQDYVVSIILTERTDTIDGMTINLEVKLKYAKVNVTLPTYKIVNEKIEKTSWKSYECDVAFFELVAFVGGIDLENIKIEGTAMLGYSIPTKFSSTLASEIGSLEVRIEHQKEAILERRSREILGKLVWNDELNNIINENKTRIEFGGLPYNITAIRSITSYDPSDKKIINIITTQQNIYFRPSYETKLLTILLITAIIASVVLATVIYSISKKLI